MVSVDRAQWLLQSIERLQRLQRELRGNEDLTALRADLEDELGETVSRRTAARFLGVSHTALDRWVDRGDLALVLTPEGRMQVPVGRLLDLRARIEERRTHGGGQGHHLEAVLIEDRRRAERMHPDRYLPEEEGCTGHQRAERRSLAYHRAVAERLTSDQVEEARHRTFRWIRDGRLDARYGDRWLELLSEPMTVIKSAITEESQRGRDLRQNSPLAGVLTEGERRRLLEAVG